MNPVSSGEIRERLARCFRGVFPGLPEAEIVRASQASMGNWDSLATITLIGVVEEEFEVRVPPLEMEDFTSFEAIVSWLEERLHVS